MKYSSKPLLLLGNSEGLISAVSKQAFNLATTWM
jgi:hypothetical protein